MPKKRVQCFTFMKNTNDTFVVNGLDGKRTLRGSVTIGGAKNAALKAMAAAILFDGPVRLENVPDNSDIETLANILKNLGAKVEVVGKENGKRENEAPILRSSRLASEVGENEIVGKIKGGQTLIIDATSIDSTKIDANLAQGMRGSVVLTGPMLARYKKVSFPAPGGCVIGARPIDLFLSGYESLGAKVNEHDCLYDISVQNELVGTEISFNKISVGATETLMMSAVLARGTTILKNCALEPEIANVAEWLNASGAKISGVGTPTITIQGTGGRLLSAKKPFVTIPDRVTAGSFLILGALCAEELLIENCRPDHLEALTRLLIESGVKIKINSDSILVSNDSAGDKVSAKKFLPYKAVPNLRTHEYPGFPTDLQSPLVTFLTQADGESTVFETIFEGRFKYTEDLIKLGANITTMNPREILIKGPTPFRELPPGEVLTAHDIRAGFAVVLAALIGKGKSIVQNVHLIDRGYERLDLVLKNLGADVERVKG